MFAYYLKTRLVTLLYFLYQFQSFYIQYSLTVCLGGLAPVLLQLSLAPWLCEWMVHGADNWFCWVILQTMQPVLRAIRNILYVFLGTSKADSMIPTNGSVTLDRTKSREIGSGRMDGCNLWPSSNPNVACLSQIGDNCSILANCSP